MINITMIDGIWHSTHSDPKIRDLFGTDTLPLPHQTWSNQNDD